jgi:hypothetical protein
MFLALSFSRFDAESTLPPTAANASRWATGAYLFSLVGKDRKMATKLKSVSLLMVLILVACTPIAPTPTSTPLMLVTSRPTAVPTATPRPTIEQYLDPLAKDNFKDLIGDVEYEELVDSIGKNGEITGTDYADDDPDGQFEGKIVPGSLLIGETADWYFKTIVLAIADNSNGDGKTGVVWNPATNNWVVVTQLNTSLIDTDNYTEFHDIDTMVERGDLALLLLSQGDFAEALSEPVQKAQYWITVERDGIIDGSARIEDYYLYLDSSRQDDVISQDRLDETNYMDILHGSFTKGCEPYRYAAIIKGTTSDMKEIYLVLNIIQNADGTNIIIPLGFDLIHFDYLQSPDISNHPNGFLVGEVLMERYRKLVPIIPTGNADDWDNFGKATVNANETNLAKDPNAYVYQGHRGGEHGILVYNFNYDDSTIVAMQIPGEVFRLLPVDMQQQINENIDFIKASNPTSDKWRSFLLPQGLIPPELAMILTRHIHETGFANGSRAQEP